MYRADIGFLFEFEFCDLLWRQKGDHDACAILMFQAANIIR